MALVTYVDPGLQPAVWAGPTLHVTRHLSLQTLQDSPLQVHAEISMP